MSDRANFLREVARRNLGQTEEAIALLLFYRQTQTFDERTASELASDFRAEGYPAPNVTRLNNALRRSRKTVAGNRNGTFQINARYINELDADYGSLLSVKTSTPPPPAVLPNEFGRGHRHFEELVKEVNGAYEQGYYNACAVILRRILESLIILIFIKHKQTDLIKVNGTFLGLEILIERILTLNGIDMSRDARKNMNKIKEIGDVAAHSRSYLTIAQDIDDMKHAARRTLDELLQALDSQGA